MALPLEELLRQQLGADRWLWSPVCLMEATEPWWRVPRHLRLLDDLLVRMQRGEFDRLMVNMPPGHSKSRTVTIANAAWNLLKDPECRVIIIGHEERFAITNYGLPIKELFEKWQGRAGLAIMEESRGKGEWKIEGHRGGVVCKGWQGGIAGRHGELFVIDDMLPNAEMALSAQRLEAQWRFMETIVAGRVQRAGVRLIVVGTRWVKGDIFGRLLHQAARTGERWELVKLKAIAGEGDILGRAPGEALWPEQVSLEVLQRHRQENGRWFEAGWQQEPVDEVGSLFKPDDWPLFGDIGGAYTLLESGQRRLYGYADVTRVLVIDWAMSGKKKSDRTAYGVFGIVPGGKMLVLEVQARQVKLERVVEMVAGMCRKWRPHYGVMEAQGFQAAMSLECRHYSEIPELRQVKIGKQTKLQRAVQSIILGENGKIYLPDPAIVTAGTLLGINGFDWLYDYKAELAGFAGLEGAMHDDRVDITAYAAQEAARIGASGIPLDEGNVPCMLTPGKQAGW